MKSAAFLVPHMQMWCLANRKPSGNMRDILERSCRLKTFENHGRESKHIQKRYPRSLNAQEKQILNQRNLTDRSHTGPELSTSFDSRFIGRLQGLLKEMIIWPAVWSWLILLATSICWLSRSTFAWQQGLLLDGFSCKYYPETASAITPKRWVLIQIVPEEAKHSHSQQSNYCKPVMQETTQQQLGVGPGLLKLALQVVGKSVCMAPWPQLQNCLELSVFLAMCNWYLHDDPHNLFQLAHRLKFLTCQVRVVQFWKCKLQIWAKFAPTSQAGSQPFHYYDYYHHHYVMCVFIGLFCFNSKLYNIVCRVNPLLHLCPQQQRSEWQRRLWILQTSSGRSRYGKRHAVGPRFRKKAPPVRFLNHWCNGSVNFWAGFYF